MHSHTDREKADVLVLTETHDDFNPAMPSSTRHAQAGTACTRKSIVGWPAVPVPEKWLSDTSSCRSRWRVDSEQVNLTRG
jgi:hypothetical protein